MAVNQGAGLAHIDSDGGPCLCGADQGGACIVGDVVSNDAAVDFPGNAGRADLVVYCQRQSPRLSPQSTCGRVKAGAQGISRRDLSRFQGAPDGGREIDLQFAGRHLLGCDFVADGQLRPIDQNAQDIALDNVLVQVLLEGVDKAVFELALANQRQHFRVGSALGLMHQHRLERLAAPPFIGRGQRAHH